MRPVASRRLTLQSSYFAMLSSSLFVFTRDRFSTSFLGRPRPLIALWLIIVTRCASGLIDLIEDRSAANRSGPAKEERKTLPG